MKRQNVSHGNSTAVENDDIAGIVLRRQVYGAPPEKADQFKPGETCQGRKSLKRMEGRKLFVNLWGVEASHESTRRADCT